MSQVKKLCVCSICVALCCVLPSAFHAAQLGTAFSPMHLPVLLCGLVCGWPYGLLCGMLGPVLSSMLTGMPGPVMLLSMVPELMVYGLVSGLLMDKLRIGHLYADLYCSLLPAMLLGRVAGGVAQAIVFLSSAREYTISIWAASYFAATLPGMILQLVLLPLIYLALTRAGLIPQRYPRVVTKA